VTDGRVISARNIGLGLRNERITACSLPAVPFVNRTRPPLHTKCAGRGVFEGGSCEGPCILGTAHRVQASTRDAEGTTALVLVVELLLIARSNSGRNVLT